MAARRTDQRPSNADGRWLLSFLRTKRLTRFFKFKMTYTTTTWLLFGFWKFCCKLRCCRSIGRPARASWQHEKHFARCMSSIEMAKKNLANFFYGKHFLNLFSLFWNINACIFFAWLCSLTTCNVKKCNNRRFEFRECSFERINRNSLQPEAFLSSALWVFQVQHRRKL